MLRPPGDALGAAPASQSDQIEEGSWRVIWHVVGRPLIVGVERQVALQFPKAQMQILWVDGVVKSSSKILAEMIERFGPVPQSFTFGDGIDWSSSLREALLYVELPYWLMVPPGPVNVSWAGVTFDVDVCSAWMEVFGSRVTDSRASVVYNGPWRPDAWQPPEGIETGLAELQLQWLSRPCKTVILIKTRAHESAFRKLTELDPPRATAEQQAYWASLCEAHLPVVNELIQRYRLVTYDYVPYEVSPWDVPIWYIRYADAGYRAVLVPYKEWDAKPVTVEEPDPPDTQPGMRQFEYTQTDVLSASSSAEATPGEFDLLDARSLMERGDYTGAVRRTVTAVEAVLRWALVRELEKAFPSGEAEERAARTDNDFPGRLSQWRKLAKPAISQPEFDEFEATRKVRHEIVHRARRLTHADRGRAQRAVDTGRWLYNKIEQLPDRTKLRDYGVLKAAGRSALAPRFPPTIDSVGITINPLA